MPLFLKLREVYANFVRQLALECTKLMNVGIFLELDILDSMHLGIIEGLATSLCQASKLVYRS